MAKKLRMIFIVCSIVAGMMLTAIGSIMIMNVMHSDTFMMQEQDERQTR